MLALAINKASFLAHQTIWADNQLRNEASQG